MKAGSTSLARYLMNHPRVFMARGKEVHYFDRHFDRGVDWYAGHFKEAPPNLALGEATPNYLYWKEAVRRMATIVPRAKLIAILRNPVDRAYSHYWHERARGRETLDFEQAIEAESDRLASPAEDVRMRFSYLDQGRYLDQLLYVTRHFPPGALLPILFEDLRQDPAGVFRAVCRFLDVDAAVLPDNVGKRYNEFIAFRSLVIRNLSRRLSSQPRGLRLLGRALGRLNARRGPYPAMARRLRATLVRHYAEANRALASWLGRDLSAWEQELGAR